MAQIQDNPIAAGLAVQPGSKAAHSRLMDDNNGPLARTNTEVWSPTSRGVAAMGVNPITGQIEPINMDRGGRIRLAQGIPVFHDQFYSNTTANPALWQVLATAMAAAQTPQSGLVLNSGNSASASVGIVYKSTRRVAKRPGETVVFRCSARVFKVTNSIVEMGFADAGAQYNVTPTALLDQSVGAYWRFTAANQLVPVISFNNTDLLTGAVVGAAFNTTDFYDFLVTVEDLGYRFAMYTKQGALVNEQIIASPVGLPKELSQPALSALIGVRNTGTAPASAPQVSVGQVSITKYNGLEGFDPNELSALQGNAPHITPSTLAQNAVYPASATAPTPTALSLTGVIVTGMGGKLVFNTIAGSEADYGLAGFVNTDVIGGGMSFICTGFRIDFSVGTVAVATTATLMELFGFTGDSVNPASANTRKFQLGLLSFPIGAAVGEARSLDVSFDPIAVNPTRALGVGLRLPINTATATQTWRGSVFFKGYWVA